MEKVWKYIAIAAIICIAFMAGNMIGNRGGNDTQPQNVSAPPAAEQSTAQPDSNTVSQEEQEDFQIIDNETGTPITMGVTGIYTSCLSGSGSDTPYIDRVESMRGTITLGGTFDITNSGSGSDGKSSYMILDVAYSENTIFCGSGGETYTADEFVEIMQSFNGLGIELEIDEGNLIKATLLS